MSDFKRLRIAEEGMNQICVVREWRGVSLAYTGRDDKHPELLSHTPHPIGESYGCQRCHVIGGDCYGVRLFNDDRAKEAFIRLNVYRPDAVYAMLEGIWREVFLCTEGMQKQVEEMRDQAHELNSNASQLEDWIRKAKKILREDTPNE